MKRGFALFRMPYARECTLISGTAGTCPCITELTGAQGFVMAPFAVTQQEPIVVISPERLECGILPEDVSADSLRVSIADIPLTADASERNDYHADFTDFHGQLTSGRFQKIVLARSVVVDSEAHETMPDMADGQLAYHHLRLFRHACQYYPRMFVCLVYTPQSGLWLAATPETLLAGEAGQWQTMALAGTMAWQEEAKWSDKNIQEQRLVATYISHLLQRFTDHFVEHSPYTVRAGHLAHLRSDFLFALSQSTPIGLLLSALHPTPAVCGLPKEETFRFILDHEHGERSYYSGFMGPFGLQGSTHLFVTLRCMHIYRNACRLYAGGGLLADSVEEQEWQETETKLDTMRHLLAAPGGSSQ